MQVAKPSGPQHPQPPQPPQPLSPLCLAVQLLEKFAVELRLEPELGLRRGAEAEDLTEVGEQERGSGREAGL